MPDEVIQVEEDEHEALVRVAKRELMETFAGSKTWECEKWLGSGSYGVTVLLRDRDPLHLHKQRRIVLKRALGPRRHYRDFKTEIYMLKVRLKDSIHIHLFRRRCFANGFFGKKHMRGNAHHGQIIEATEETGLHRVGKRTIFGRMLRRIKSAFNNPPREIFKILGASYGPAILLEYIENGTLRQVQNRAYEGNIEIPNRILWSFYLCCKNTIITSASPKGDATS